MHHHVQCKYSNQQEFFTDAEMSDAEAALKSVGVSVRRADGDLRDISDTLDDLNKVCIMQ